MSGKKGMGGFASFYRSQELPGIYDEKLDYSDPEMCECGNPRCRKEFGLPKACDRCLELEHYFDSVGQRDCSCGEDHGI